MANMYVVTIETEALVPYPTVPTSYTIAANVSTGDADPTTLLEWQCPLAIACMLLFDVQVMAVGSIEAGDAETAVAHVVATWRWDGGSLLHQFSSDALVLHVNGGTAEVVVTTDGATLQMRCRVTASTGTARNWRGRADVTLLPTTT